MQPPNDRDREHAGLILDHINRLRELGAFAGEETRESEINFIALMLRNERANVIKQLESK